MTRQRALAFVVAVMVVASGAGLVAAVGADLSFSDPDVQPPDPVVNETTLTVNHHMVDGTGDASLLEYRNDSGDRAVLPARVNDSITNIVSLTATHINDSDLKQFPRKSDEGDNGAAFHDSSEWSKSGQNSSDLTISDVETASGVDAVRLDTGTAMSSSPTALGVYSNFSITTDESKRFIILFADIDTLDSATDIEIRIYDEDGEYKTVWIDSDKNANDADVLANSTGDGQVTQTQLADISTNGGTFSNIENVTVNITGGDVDASFSVIDLDKKSSYDLGAKKEDTDSDGDLETTDHVEPNGQYDIHSLSTLDSAFNDAIIVDMQVNGVEYHAADLDQDATNPERVNATFEDADEFPGFDRVLDVYYRLEVPAAIDLSHSGLKLRHHTRWPSERYVLVEYKEGVSDDTNFTDISGWSAETSNFDAADKNVTIDDTVSTDNNMVLHYRIKLTQPEADAMQATATNASAGGAAPPQQGGGLLGGFVNFLGTPLGMVTGIGTIVLAFFRNSVPGLRRVFGG